MSVGGNRVRIKFLKIYSDFKTKLERVSIYWSSVSLRVAEIEGWLVVLWIAEKRKRRSCRGL